MSRRYEKEYEESIHAPEKFWGKAAQGIQWHKPYTKVLDDTFEPFYRWFTGGELNTCFNAIDRHVLAGRGKQFALIYDSPVTNTIKKITYQELLNEVSKFAGVLTSFEVKKSACMVLGGD
jgi:propionyl-CoA synthetase